MGIYASVGAGEPADLPALHITNEPPDVAYYQARGEPDVWIDVATATSWHDHTRLSIIDNDYGWDVEVLIAPAQLDQLIDRLAEAREKIHDTAHHRASPAPGPAR